MTIYEKAKQLNVDYNRVHETHLKVWAERNKPATSFDPMFFHNEMALALAVERIKELEGKKDMNGFTYIEIKNDKNLTYHTSNELIGQPDHSLIITNDLKVVIGDGVSLDEASKLFYDCLAANGQEKLRELEQAKACIRQLEAEQ